MIKLFGTSIICVLKTSIYQSLNNKFLSLRFLKSITIVS